MVKTDCNITNIRDLKKHLLTLLNRYCIYRNSGKVNNE